MADRLCIALAQINPTLGDIAGNLALLRRVRAEAAEQRADLVITPELSITAYPPEDLVLKPAFLDAARPPHRWIRVAWVAVVYGTRVLLIFLRSIPEYVWAFLLISMIGPSAWPAVLALAIHNAGILGKLGGEVVESLDGRSLSALRGLGATRRQIALAAIFPEALSRFLLFLFYRWETCVREATVLGMLGIVSLGYWIQDARARNQYDTMIFLVALGVAIVLIGDLISAVARRLVRNSA